MIDLINISKSYKASGIRKVVLDRVTSSFPRDKNIAIVGANGAGKSTLMRIIAGIETPDSGHIVRHGTISWPLGFSNGFNGSMTGLENIRFVARIYGQDTGAVIEYVRDFSDLGESLRLPVKTYSSGMKARLAFGMSLAIDFDCYLIDEVIAVGDERFKKRSKQAFDHKLPKSQIIMASHSIGSIKEYCHCGYILKNNLLNYFHNVDDLIIELKNIS